MSVHITKFRKGFTLNSINWITRADEKQHNTGINFGICAIDRTYVIETNQEICIVVLNGEGWLETDDLRLRVSRNSLFDENPTCVHMANQKIVFRCAKTDYLEFAVIETINPKSFFYIYTPEKIKSEIRGKGTMKRTVKTIFDYETQPDSNLVIGEVITLPGRYSSAPPHHHPQPEIYFYRFLPEQGFGFAELGDNRALKVKNNDAVKILNNQDHMQTSAPGYYMWYLWIIRHLPENLYKGFEYNPKHEWVLGGKK